MGLEEERVTNNAIRRKNSFASMKQKLENLKEEDMKERSYGETKPRERTYEILMSSQYNCL